MARDIHYTDFQAFVDEKGLERPCAICGTNDWQMLGGDDEVPAEPKDQFMFLGTFPELTDYPHYKPDRSFPAYIMYCGNCGLIMPIAAVVVWQWVEGRDGRIGTI